MDFKIEKINRSRTNEELLTDLKKVAEANSGNITQKIYNDFRNSIDPTIASVTLICRQIGWNNALEEIGIELGKFQKNSKITEEELLEEILKIWTELGRQPTTGDIKKGSGKYPRNRYSERFGSWENTLQSFVEWVSNNEVIIPSPITGNENDNRRNTTIRDINLRLRFKVMKRDNFKCCLCGKAPANDSEVELHVDHIIPWVKGGETEIKNLQTLCSKCNLGKSDLT